jgi:hypothetical protein
MVRPMVELLSSHHSTRSSIGIYRFSDDLTLGCGCPTVHQRVRWPDGIKDGRQGGGGYNVWIVLQWSPYGSKRVTAGRFIGGGEDGGWMVREWLRAARQGQRPDGLNEGSAEGRWLLRYH